MKLKHILTKPALIEYRTNGPLGESIFVGECKYDGEKLVPLDHDNYSLEDEISSYKISELDEQDLQLITVFYESEWIVK